MAGYTAPGNVLSFVAPSGGVTKGIFVIIGGTLVVPIVSALVGETFAGYVSGVHPGVKASGTTAASGAACYYDSSSGLCESSDSATNRRIGVFAEAAANGSTSCSVRLDGVSFGAGDLDLESKADKIAPASAHNFAGLTAAGNLEDSGHAHADYAAAAHNHDASYISIVGAPTTGNLPVLTAGGELSDSGSKPADFAAAGHNHDSDYVSVVAAPTAGHIAQLTAGGEIEDGGSAISDLALVGHNHDSDYVSVIGAPVAGDLVQQTADGEIEPAGVAVADLATAAQGAKADTAQQQVGGAVENNVATWNAAGSTKDSGTALASLAVAANVLALAGGTMTGKATLEKGTASDGDSDDSITLHKQSGVVTTKSLNTAAGALYQFTLVNDRIVDADTPVVATVLHGGTCTKMAVVHKVSPGAGSAVVYLLNADAADALDGTVRVAFIVS